jgi:hypothetical protein
LLPNDPSLAALAHAPELTDTLEILFSGFAIGGSATDQDTGTGPCTGKHCVRPLAGKPVVTSHLVLRSLIGLMAAAAQEQAFYDALAKSGKTLKSPWKRQPGSKNPCRSDDRTGIGSKQSKQDNPNYLRSKQKLQGMTFTFSQLVPPIERLPVLRLTWPAEVKPPVSHFAVYAKDYGLSLTLQGQRLCRRRRRSRQRESR